MMRSTLLIGVAAVLTSAAWADDDDSVDLSQVPAAAKKAAEKAIPGIKLTEAYKGVEEGKTIYELSGEDPQGRDVSVEVTPEGKILSISVEIPLQQVPRVVANALRTKVKGFKAEVAMAVRIEGKIAEYYFEGKSAQGKDIGVTVSADGSDVEVDEDP
jgi:hypothetical protein